MKEKGKLFGKILGIFIIVLLLLGLAVGTGHVTKTMLEDDSLEGMNITGVTSIPYTMYYVANRNVGNKILTPEELFFSKELLDNKEFGKDYGYYDLDEFSDYINHWTSCMSWSKSVFGALYDAKTGKELYRIKNYNDITFPENQTGNITEEVKEKALCAFLLSYDSSGKLTVHESFGMDEREAQALFEQNSLINQYQDLPIIKFAEDGLALEIQGGVETFRSLKDVAILIGISKSAVSYTEYDPYVTMNDQVQEGFAFLLLGVLAILLIAAILLVAIKPLQVNQTVLAKIPIEVVMAAALVVLYLVYGISGLCFGSVSHRIYQMLIERGNLPKNLALGMEQGALYGSLILYYGTILAGMIATLQVFIKGIKRFWYENVLTVRVFCSIKRGVIKLFYHVFYLNSKEPITKFMLRVVLFNAAIMSLLCCLWFFGIFGVVVYSILLVFLLGKYLRKLKDQYDQVLLMTTRLAEGNFEVSLHEDCGIFEPIAKELEMVQAGFQAAVSEEVKSTKMRTDLISNVSHDLKTPLTAIITYVNLLKEENLTEEQKNQYVETLDRKSMRLKQLIEDLFEVSKMSSNNVTLDFAKIDLVELIEQVHVELSDRFENAGITFRLSAPDEKVVLSLDGQKTCRVFENLFVNIINYAMPQTRAYVTVEKKEDQVRVTVKNISAIEMNVVPEELIERFVRGDASRTTEGSGLGLAIAKSIVELEHGTLQVVMDGDLFKVIIEFPLSNQEVPESNQEELS